MLQPDPLTEKRIRESTDEIAQRRTDSAVGPAQASVSGA